MPTREERLAAVAATSQAKSAREQRTLAATQSAQREEQRTIRDRRRSQVGTWCDEAGLLGCDDVLLQALLHLCHAIAASATPGATLAACQERVRGMPGTSPDGMAHPADGGSPSGAA